MIRVGLFAVVLAALFGGALGVGAAVGPLKRGTAAPAAHDPMAAITADGPAGLAIAADGVRLVPARPVLDAGRMRPFTFRIVDGSGRPVRTFDIEHTKRMHLVVVRRDLTGFQHLHPVLRTDGTWTIPLRLRQPGAYRAFADFSTGGKKTVLGVDLTVAGASTPKPLPDASLSTTTDGYRVSLREGALTAGGESTLSFAVSRHGRAVRPGPYLGARGHLVVLREGDLGYSHVHPHEDSLDFDATFASVGRYRAFLQFSAGGSVHTAAFTVVVRR
jgi:hypothetical protein